jgi:hypothetical protein
MALLDRVEDVEGFGFVDEFGEFAVEHIEAHHGLPAQVLGGPCLMEERCDSGEDSSRFLNRTVSDHPEWTHITDEATGFTHRQCGRLGCKATCELFVHDDGTVGHVAGLKLLLTECDSSLK